MTTNTVEGVRIDERVPVAMRDGVVLRADVYTPPGQGPFPVLVQRTPYDKRVAQTIVYAHPVWYARHGYIVVVQDCRGRYQSDGSFYPLRNEGQDGHDTIDWAASLPRCNGRVGTFGFSYAGAAQLMAARSAPSGLRCMVPAFTASEYFDGWTYRGGAFQVSFVVAWLLQTIVVPDLVKQGHLDAARGCVEALRNVPELYAYQPLTELPPLAGLRDSIPYYFDWLEHDVEDAYWDALAISKDLHDISVPALHVGGWYDTFVDGTVRNFQLKTAAGSPHDRLIVGPWLHVPWSQHVGARDFGPEARNALDAVQIRWFDEHLYERPAERSPRVRYFVMNRDEWSEGDQWPPVGATPTEWYLRSDGLANSLSGNGYLSKTPPAVNETPDRFVFVPQAPVPSSGGRSCCDPAITPMGVGCQTGPETRNDVLVFTSDVLDEPLEVSGHVELRLFAATDAVETDWTAKLVDVRPDGRALNVCDGILRSSYRESSREPTHVTPREVYEYAISLGHTSIEFQAGHRLRLEVSSSNFPQYDVNPNDGSRVSERDPLAARTAMQTVLHDNHHPSRLLLSGVPADAVRSRP